MSELEKIEMIREAMPAVRESVYLNTGSVGPLSTLTAEAMAESDRTALGQGRASIAGFMAFQQSKNDLRQAFADLVKAEVSEIALTHHTTDGMNIATHGLTWQPGDEIVTTNLEHPGGLLPLYVVRQRWGVVVKVVDIPANIGPAEIVSRLEAAITPRTRLLATSHVAWNTGMVLPLSEIVAMAHRHHVLVAIDGAQSTGAIPLDLPASGVDFYAMPGQKWLCGPEGTGALFVRRDRLNELAPTYVGYASMNAVGGHDWTGYFLPHPDARRYEVGTVNRPGLTGMLANLRWLQNQVGWSWIHQRIWALASYASETLSALPGVQILTPPEAHAGLVTFTLAGYDPTRVMMKLAEEGIVLRYVGEPYALRISTGFYNTEADIDRLASALQAVQKIDPSLLPEPSW
jgi:L-cysteine/cystine lyase